MAPIARVCVGLQADLFDASALSAGRSDKGSLGMDSGRAHLFFVHDPGLRKATYGTIPKTAQAGGLALGFCCSGQRREGGRLWAVTLAGAGLANGARLVFVLRHLGAGPQGPWPPMRREESAGSLAKTGAGC